MREGFENGDIAGGSGDKAVKRSFENIRSGDIPAKENAQIPGRLWGADVGPRRIGPVRSEIKVFGRDDVGFVCVDPQARGLAEGVDKTQRWPKGGKTHSLQGDIISASRRLNVGEGRETMEENVVANYEKKGRKGAALLDAPPDIDPEGRGAGEGRLDLTAVEDAVDNGAEPGWQPAPANSFMNEVVIDRVKGFGGVHKKDEKVPHIHLFAFSNGVEALVKPANVVFEGATRDKTLLSGVEGGKKSGGDSLDNDIHEDAVVGVGD